MEKRNWTDGDIVRHFAQATKNGWVPFFEEASVRWKFPTELLLALGSRESNMSNILGDMGHGHGIMQIDDRSFWQFCHSGQWKDPRTNILFGGQVLRGKLDWLTSNCRRPKVSRHGTPYTPRPLLGEDLIQAAVAAYNTGEGNALYGWSVKNNVDYTTAHGNYSEDVFARVAILRERYAQFKKGSIK